MYIPVNLKRFLPAHHSRKFYFPHFYVTIINSKLIAADIISYRSNRNDDLFIELIRHRPSAMITVRKTSYNIFVLLYDRRAGLSVKHKQSHDPSLGSEFAREKHPLSFSPLSPPPLLPLFRSIRCAESTPGLRDSRQ